MPHNVESIRKPSRSYKMTRASVGTSSERVGKEEDSERHLKSMQPSVSGDTADEIVARSVPGSVDASQPSQPKRIVNRLKCELMGRREAAQVFGGMEGKRNACHLFGTQALPSPCIGSGRVWQDGFRQGGRSPIAARAGREKREQIKSRKQIRHQMQLEKSERLIVVGAWESHVHGEGVRRSENKFGGETQVMSERKLAGWRS
jgi:hypothetical protein